MRLTIKGTSEDIEKFKNKQDDIFECTCFGDMDGTSCADHDNCTEHMESIFEYEEVSDNG